MYLENIEGGIKKIRHKYRRLKQKVSNMFTDIINHLPSQDVGFDPSITDMYKHIVA
jgi:hypothetical protein